MSDIDVLTPPTLRPPRRPAHRSRRMLASIAAFGLALSGVALNATTSAADSAITPGSGPIAGGTTVTVPAEVTDLKFESVHAQETGSIALTAEGNAYVLGFNNFGNLGFGQTATTFTTPTYLPMPDGVTISQLSTGGYHAIALGSDGLAYAWGSNQDGRLGIGSDDESVSAGPVTVATEPGITFKEVAAGNNVSMALDTDGHVWAWGSNAWGQLGDTTRVGSNSPVRVPLPEDLVFTHIAQGGSRGLAITSDGTAYSGGSGHSPMVGDILTPAPVSMPTGVTKFTTITGSRGGFVAVGDAGNVYAWGGDDAGPGFGGAGYGGDSSGGNPTLGSDSRPVEVLNPTAVELGTNSAVVAIDGNQSSPVVAVLTADGQIITWGSGAQHGMTGAGGLGLGTGKHADGDWAPQAVQTNLCNSFESVAVQGNHGSAVGCGGQLYAWGSFWTKGGVPLGDEAATEESFVPVLVAEPIREVTSVTFDGLEGTNLSQVADESWTVNTPAHAAGTVDVVVTTALADGSDVQSKTYAQSYTYVAPLVTITPTPPTQVGDTVTIPTQDGVIYQIDGQPVTGDIVLNDGESIWVDAIPADGYVFTDGVGTRWPFTYNEDSPSPSGTPSAEPSDASPAAGPTDEPNSDGADIGTGGETSNGLAGLGAALALAGAGAAALARRKH